MKRILLSILSVSLLLSVFSVLPIFAATSSTALDGKVQIENSTGTYEVTISGSNVTTYAEGGLSGREDATITITNLSQSQATVSFGWEVSNCGNYTAPDGSSQSTILNAGNLAASGTYSAVLANGETITMKIGGRYVYRAGKAEVKLINLTWTEVQSNSKVTVTYNENYGKVTSGDSTVTSGTIIEGNQETSVSLTAAAENNGIFLGWIDANGLLLSTKENYILNPTNDITVKAIFGHTNLACFYVGGGVSIEEKYNLLGMSKFTYHTVPNYTYLFEDLNDAVVAAQNSASKYVVLANNSTLPAGDYHIYSGVTLIIPFDQSNTTYTDKSQFISSYATPSAYRTLTMAEGANIIVDSGGSMSVPGMHRYAGGGTACSPTGPLGMIKMEEGSSITVNGNLYAYGYIYGSGEIGVGSTGSVYELLQVYDCRGGTVTTNLNNDADTYGVFPFSQYRVQNIEVETTYAVGGVLNANLTMYMSSTSFCTGFKMIGQNDALINLTSGTLTKHYDGKKDRIIIDVSGNVTLSEVSLEVNYVTINSSNFEFPINSSWTINFYSGEATIKQDMSFIPGSEVYIAEDANVILGDGVNVYIYDADQWGKFCYSSETSVDVKQKLLKYSPTLSYTRTEADLVDTKIHVNGTIDASSGNLYTTEGGANICSTGAGKVILPAIAESTTYQFSQIKDDDGYGVEEYVGIEVKSSKLKNGNGEYVETVAGTYVYDTEHDKWALKSHTFNEGVTTAPTCIEGGYTTHTCSCGYSYTDNEVEATGHDYTNSVVSYNWTDDYTACTASHSCTVCGHTETATATSTSEITVATCTTDGKIVYTATFTGGWAETQTQTIVLTAKGHDYVEHVCSGCGITDLIQLVGRTLKYVDTINVICLFEFSSDAAVVKDDGGKITNAGIVVWETKPTVDSLMNGSAPSGNTEVVDSLKTYPDNASYYYAEASGITASNLHKSAYYAGYIVDGDGNYLYSEVFEYSPSIYAYNMLAKETGTEEHQAKQETQDLCVALLNYISAAQQYFGYDEVNDTTVDADELVNKDLSDDQKIVPSSLELNLTQIAEIGTSDSLFTRVGKNLYFNDRVNLAAMFEFEDESTDISKSGTIFWTSSQWETLGYTSENMPNKDSHGGTSAALELYSGSVYASICPINIAPKDMKDTKIYSMGYVYTGNVDNDEYVYSSVKAYGIEDYISLIINMETTEGSKEAYMQLLAKRLYQYERAANAALLNS